MSANPILIEQTRGSVVENRHRAAFVVADSAGRIIVSAGETGRPVFPRSAVKSMQALAIFTSRAARRFGLSDTQLALACASHHGEDIHVRGVAAFLAQLGLSEADLECGVHQPNNAAAREALRARGAKASPLHNNCSGKHAGMLAVARALGAPTQGYVLPDHPAQQEVRRVIAAVIGEDLADGRCATDGCSVPTWATPLSALARGFARMASADLPGELGAAAARLFDAATRNPLLVAGTGHFDTQVMEAFGGRVMQKGGAEGVQCGAIRDRGWGYALKVDDGNMNASLAIAAGLLLALAEPDRGQREVLARFARPEVQNARGIVVGGMRGTDALAAALRVA